MRPFLSILSAIAVSGCALPPAPHPTAGTQEQALGTYLPDAQMKEIQAEIAKKLKDPSSAQFGQVSVGKFASGDLILCGWINGKNSYGAYTGMRPFIAMYVYASKYVDFSAETSEYHVIEAMCRSRGISVPPAP